MRVSLLYVFLFRTVLAGGAMGLISYQAKRRSGERDIEFGRLARIKRR